MGAVKLLEDGYHVHGLTLSANARDFTELPKRRAIELYAQHPNRYSWSMGDFSDRDHAFKSWIEENVSSELPKSCLVCALSKITSTIPLCLQVKIPNLALGYTDYQSNWSEQTSVAIKAQIAAAKERGVNLLLPAREIQSKHQVKEMLVVRGLTSNSLENPCCIAKWGTQDVPEVLIEETVKLAFDYKKSDQYAVEIIETVGNTSWI